MLAFGLALTVLWFGHDSASAYCRMTTQGDLPIGSSECDERGAFLEWDTLCLSYAVDVRGSQWMSFEQTETAVDAGFFAWTQVQCDAGPTHVSFQPLDAATCKKPEYNDGDGNVNTVAFLDPWVDPSDGASFPRQALALTIVWHDEVTGQILDVDMLINDTEPICPRENPSCGGFDLQSIVTHESGHFLGIGHSPVENATMHFRSPEPGNLSPRTLAEDDISALCAIYPSGSPAPVCSALDFEPGGGLDLDCEDDPRPGDCDPVSEPCPGGSGGTGGAAGSGGFGGSAGAGGLGGSAGEAGAGGCEQSSEDCGQASGDVEGQGGSGCSVTEGPPATELWLCCFWGLGLLLARARREAGRA